MKKVWISALAENQPRVGAVTAHLKPYGLACLGHFWADAPEKQSWRAALNGLLESRADVWLVLADEAEFAKPGVRYGLSLMMAALRQAKGAGFPVLMLWNSPAPAAATLPILLQSATLIEESSSAWAAKIVARANMPGKAAASDYRFDILGDERLGQWFEIGPREGSWNGVVLGVRGEGAGINFQAVGPSGALPQTATLEFAQEGLKIEASGGEFTAWAVRNVVGPDSSYYARITGTPEEILFMPYAEADEDAGATVLRLK